MLRIDAVTVCVNYADFLAESARHNRHLFNRWVIVTEPDDKATIEVCRKYNLQCLPTGEHKRDGRFNKGRAISLGMNMLATDSWMLHLDADVVLPATTLQMLEVAHLDPASIYGVDRICLHSWEEWKTLEASGYLLDQHAYQLVAFRANAGEVAHRIYKESFGYVPIGYFQLFWHSARDGRPRRDYPHSDSDAAHSDIKFALQWDRRNRVLIPEIFAVHLESERSNYGVNWKGRKSKPFGPSASAPPDAARSY